MVFSCNTWSCYSTAFLNFLCYMYSSTSRKFKKAVEKHGGFRVFFLSSSSLLVVMDKDIQDLFLPRDDRSKNLLSSFYLHAWIMVCNSLVTRTLFFHTLVFYGAIHENSRISMRRHGFFYAG